MKLTKLPHYLLGILIGISLFSCEKDQSQELLYKAQNSLDKNKPDVALNILASIRNPQNMDEHSYMQYIVTYVGAKYEAKKDIKADSLILEAQEYFNKKGNYEESTLANYYAAQLYDVNANYPKALESYMYTVYAADKSNNNLLVGKSLNNIGYIYYEQDLLDSAIVNYQKALSFYNKVENADNNKLMTFTYLGRTFEESNKFDSAYLYYTKALNKATEANDEKYKSFSLQNLGVLCYNMKEYEKAIEYFQSALKISSTDKEHIQKIQIGMLMIYNKKQDLNSAKQYVDLVIEGLPEVTYNYTIKEMYAALADYCQQSGDYKQALHYRDLEQRTKDQIELEINVAALLGADKNFYLTQKDKEVQEFASHIYLILIFGAVVIGIVFLFVLFIWRDHKKGQAEIRACAEKYDIIKGMLLSMSDRYPKIEKEIKDMMEDD